ncbi:hypothetical protein TNCV_4106201 [Trichonephila clavipes]|nr:hypothetical protein TNCV_4106201 [Trichonephila clavipes]
MDDNAQSHQLVFVQTVQPPDRVHLGLLRQTRHCLEFFFKVVTETGHYRATQKCPSCHRFSIAGLEHRTPDRKAWVRCPMPTNTLRVHTVYVFVKSVGLKILWVVAAEITGARGWRIFPFPPVLGLNCGSGGAVLDEIEILMTHLSMSGYLPFRWIGIFISSLGIELEDHRGRLWRRWADVSQCGISIAFSRLRRF